MRLPTFFAAILAIASAPSFSADNPWVGTWKLDPSKSHLAGDTISFSRTRNGLYHFSDGSTIHFDFALDGKDYKSAYNHTQSWTPIGEHAWHCVVKADGKVLYEIHRELSADGKTLTVTVGGTSPDGSARKDVTVYERIGGSEGLIGKWRSTQVTSASPDVFVISAPAPGVMRWQNLLYQSDLQGKADGTDIPITGPTQPPGLTFSYHFKSPKEISYVMRINGKPDAYGIDTLSANDQSWTDISWSPGKEKEKSTSVYVRQ